MIAFTFLKEALDAFFVDRVPRLGAALAYYSVFSLAPLLLIAISIAGAVFGHDAALGYVANVLDDAIGRPNALAVQQMVQNARHPAGSVISSILGVSMLLLGASGVFMQLKDALNTIWGVESPDVGLLGLIRQTFLSVTAVLGTGFLLMISLVLSAILSGLNAKLAGLLPGGAGLWNALNQLISFGVFTGIFALTYKYLPNVEVAWRDVILGAVVAAVLFTLGKYALGLYIGLAAVGSPFGAAGSLAVIMIWVFYAAQILFFGAELTKVSARHGQVKSRGTSPRPQPETHP